MAFAAGYFPIYLMAVFPVKAYFQVMKTGRAKILCLAILLCGSGPARADQREPELTALFQQLSRSDLAAPEAALIEGKIRELWQHSDSPTADLLLQRANYLLQNRLLDEAVQLLNEMIALTPDYAEAWNKRATIYYAQGNYQQALKDIEQTLRLEPRHFGALTGLGAILVVLGEEGRALKAYQQALKINPHIASVKKEVERLTLSLRGRGI